MSVKSLWWIVAMLVLVAIALWGNTLQRQLITPAIIETSTVLGDCDLQQEACTAYFEDGSHIALNILPKPIPLLAELNLNVTLSNAAMVDASSLSGVNVSFVGLNMEMGFNRITLQSVAPPSAPPHSSNAVSRQYRATAILPVCTLRRMQWEARVFIDTPLGVKAALFPFYTIKE